MNSETINFVHLSDPHLPENKETTVSGVQPYKKLVETLKSINQLASKPRFAIITGDLIQKGATKGYKLVKQYTDNLEKTNIPTLLILGNHDNRPEFRKTFQTENLEGPVFYVKEYDGFRIICLDSLYPGSNTGYFTGNQLKWLKKVLREDPQQPTVIALHHPINLPWVKYVEKEFDSTQRDQFYEIIAGSNVLAVVNGHLHHSMIANMNGVLHIQASSTKSELVFNGDDYWVRDTLCYNQVFIDDNRVYVTTHSLPYDGRVLSQGSLQELLQGRY